MIGFFTPSEDAVERVDDLADEGVDVRLVGSLFWLDGVEALDFFRDEVLRSGLERLLLLLLLRLELLLRSTLELLSSVVLAATIGAIFDLLGTWSVQR